MNTKSISKEVALVLLRLLVATELHITSYTLSYLLVSNDLQSSNLHIHCLQHIVRISIHLNLILLKSRNSRDEIETTLSLLLLKLQRNTTHRSSLDSLHQMLTHHKPSNNRYSHVSSDLVSHSLGREISTLINNLTITTLLQISLSCCYRSP